MSENNGNGKEIFGRIWDAHRVSGWYKISDLSREEIDEGIREGNASLDAIIAAPPPAITIGGFNKRSFTASMLSAVLPRIKEAEAVGLASGLVALLARIDSFIKEEEVI